MVLSFGGINIKEFVRHAFSAPAAGAAAAAPRLFLSCCCSSSSWPPASSLPGEPKFSPWDFLTLLLQSKLTVSHFIVCRTGKITSSTFSQSLSLLTVGDFRSNLCLPVYITISTRSFVQYDSPKLTQWLGPPQKFENCVILNNSVAKLRK